MKVFLINPDYMVYPDPPLALTYLAAYIRKYLPETDIRIIDQLPEKKILKKIKKEKPSIIGFSSASQNYYKVKTLALQIKKISSAILVLGGIHVTNLPQSFQNSPFDIAVIGEGERTFKNLIENIEQNHGINNKEIKKIKGLLLRDKEKGKEKIINTGFGERIENLDEIPLPARDLLNMRYYTLASISGNPDPWGIMLTSRGCPYNCKFCSSTKFWGRKINFFSAKRVAEEIEEMHKKYGYRAIEVYDDLFTFNKTRLREIVKILKQKKILGKIKFSVMGRGNCFDEELAQILNELNVVNIYFGIESGSPKMVNYLKDKITLEDNIKAINIAKKYGINPGGLFMIGMPHETEEDMKATYDFIIEHLPKNYSLGQMSAYPNTEIWDYAVKNKLIKEEMYEKKGRGFLEFNKNDSLTLETDKETLEQYWNKIKAINPKKKFEVKRFLALKPRHIIKLLSPTFLKKAYYLGIKKVKQD